MLALCQEPMQCMFGEFVSLYSCTAHIGNGTGHRTATMTAPLLLTLGSVRYEALLHSCGTSPVRRRVPTCDSVHSWQLHSAASLEHHDLLSHSITLSWHWTDQTLSYPNNSELQARKQQVSILKPLVWLDQVSNLRVTLGNASDVKANKWCKTSKTKDPIAVS